MTESTRTASCDAAPVADALPRRDAVRRRQERGVDGQRTRVADDIALDHASRAEVRPPSARPSRGRGPRAARRQRRRHAASTDRWSTVRGDRTSFAAMRSTIPSRR